MLPELFDPNQFERGNKRRLDLAVPVRSGPVSLPVLLARGAHPGKCLLVTAGVHGDELEGVQAVMESFHELDTSLMSGDLLAVPAANPPALWAGTRTSPLDGGNLARAFPGDPQGTVTLALAWALAQHVIPHADFYLDLHSGGIGWLMPTLAGYSEKDPRSCAAAAAFGAPIVWAHPSVGPGRTLTAAEARGIPWLYTEARGGGRVDAQDLAIFKRGLINLMQHLEILAGEPTAQGPQIHLRGEGSMENGVTATRSGFFVPAVHLLQQVRAGDELGLTTDLHGAVVEQFRAPCNGLVVLLRAFPVVQPGDPVGLVTGVATEHQDNPA